MATPASAQPYGRLFNFSAGPATLPLGVLEQAQAELLNWRGTGMSVLEMSHRSPGFEAILGEAEADLRTLYGLPANYRVLFLQGVPLTCDASSDFISRPVDLTRYGLVYAGAQKNAGPAGVTIVIIREDLLARTPAKLPIMLDYKLQAENKSLYNTPPCFAIYLVGLVFKWVLGLGGLAAIAERNAAKAGLIYSAIDRSGGFYRGLARPDSRSKMNVTFRLPDEALEAQFAREAARQGLDGLKGHRSVGGIRASLYNALPPEAAQALADFMAEFQRRHG